MAYGKKKSSKMVHHEPDADEHGGAHDYDYDDPKGRPKYTGALHARAKKHGMSKHAFAQANIHSNTVVGKMARVAQVADNLHGAGKSAMNRPGDKRSLGQRLYQVG